MFEVRAYPIDAPGFRMVKIGESSENIQIGDIDEIESCLLLWAVMIMIVKSV